MVLFDWQTRQKYTDLILTHSVSFSAVYVNLRHGHILLCLPEYFPKWVFSHNFVCMYPSVEVLFETRCLIHATISLCARQRLSAENGALVPIRRLHLNGLKLIECVILQDETSANDNF